MYICISFEGVHVEGRTNLFRIALEGRANVIHPCSPLSHLAPSYPSDHRPITTAFQQAFLYYYIVKEHSCG